MVHCYVQKNITLGKLEIFGYKVNNEKDLIESLQSLAFWVDVNQRGQGLLLLSNAA